MSVFQDKDLSAEEDKGSQDEDADQDSEYLISEALAYLDKEKLYGRYEEDTSDEEDGGIKDRNISNEAKGLEEKEDDGEDEDTQDADALNMYAKLDEEDGFGDFQGFSSELMEPTLEGYMQMTGNEVEDVEYTTVAVDSPVSPSSGRGVARRSLPPLSADKIAFIKQAMAKVHIKPPSMATALLADSIVSSKIRVGDEHEA
eukprot:gene42106-51413_t